MLNPESEDMTDQTDAVAIEEELPHEIYGNIISSSITQHDAKIAYRSLHITNNHGARDRNVVDVRYNRGAPMLIETPEVIPNEEDSVANNLKLESCSQFINFYRKSCQGATDTNGINKQPSTHSHATNDLSTKKAKKYITSKKEGASRSSQPLKKITKAERKRIARKEHERNIQREKRIRMMLQPEISDEYEKLYAALHR